MEKLHISPKVTEDFLTQKLANVDRCQQTLKLSN